MIDSSVPLVAPDTDSRSFVNFSFGLSLIDRQIHGLAHRPHYTLTSLLFSKHLGMQRATRRRTTPHRTLTSELA